MDCDFFACAKKDFSFTVKAPLMRLVEFSNSLESDVQPRLD